MPYSTSRIGIYSVAYIDIISEANCIFSPHSNSQQKITPPTNPSPKARQDNRQPNSPQNQNQNPRLRPNLPHQTRRQPPTRNRHRTNPRPNLTQRVKRREVNRQGQAGLLPARKGRQGEPRRIFLRRSDPTKVSLTRTDWVYVTYVKFLAQ
jgi:hypothetical protein